MGDFSYYDFLSNVVPGCIFLWGLSFFGPLDSGKGLISLLTGNTIVDGVLFVILAYFVGLVLQYFSRKFIARILKKIFWDGHYFSEIALLKPLNKIDPELIDKIIEYAEKTLNLENAKILQAEDILSNESNKKSAMRMSQLIYRMIDAKTVETKVGQKAQLQNTFYSFFKNLSMCFLSLFIIDISLIILGLMPINLRNFANVVIICLMFFIFLDQARYRGELYIKGLFWSFG